jgi:uncharacterized protein
MQHMLGRDGAREIALATLFGAVSSSCSYASAAISRALFRRGAALVPALAFLFASTNLVVELGMALIVFLGWRFAAAEWIGGVVLIGVMTLLVRLTYPARLAEAARSMGQAGSGDQDLVVPGRTLGERLRNPLLPGRVAQIFAMDLAMLWKDLVLGFLIAGCLAAWIPAAWWGSLFLQAAPSWVRVPAGALIGPLVAVLSFVCSIGNVPLAAVLWRSGAPFGGVLSFLYADLIVLPLLDVYRRYYGLRMAAYLTAVFYTTMAVSALLMDAGFAAAGLTPKLPGVALPASVSFSPAFAIDHTFWLNLLSGGAGLFLVWLARRHPAPTRKACCHGRPDS